MPSSGQYRINKATMVLFFEDGRHVAHTIPAGSVITIVDPATFNGDKLVSVIWAEKEAMMFTQDIRTRGEELS